MSTNDTPNTPQNNTWVNKSNHVQLKISTSHLVYSMISDTECWWFIFSKEEQLMDIIWHLENKSEQVLAIKFLQISYYTLF